MFFDSAPPLPALLNFEAEHQKMQALATENHHLHNQLASTKQALAEAESTVQKLEAKLASQMALHATAAASKRRSVDMIGVALHHHFHRITIRDVTYYVINQESETHEPLSPTERQLLLVS